ncbi:MAG: PaaI family thioesterase [Myxococcota bacterium]
MTDESESNRRFTHWDASSMEATSGAWVERRRLAAAMRVVIERLVVSDAPEQELRRAADALESYADQLATHPKNVRYESWAETSPSGDVAGFFDQSPLIGRANPLSPPIVLEALPTENKVRGHVVFGSAYEGPPGCVHGGFVAAAFDEVLGFANSISGNPGMTAELTVRYRKPTPLHSELRFEAELLRVEGRKNFTAGRVLSGDLVTAEAEGLFIAVDRQKFKALYEARQRRERERSPKH